MKYSELRTPLAKARGLGSAKDGTSHFIWQRITALIMIPLAFWFVSSLMQLATTGDPQLLREWLSSGLRSAALIVILLALFYHAKLGLQVVIEDYIHTPFFKYACLFFNIIVMYGFAVISILAVLQLHLGAGG